MRQAAKTMTAKAMIMVLAGTAMMMANGTQAQSDDGPQAYLVKDMDTYMTSYKAEMAEGRTMLDAAGQSEDAKDLKSACASAGTALSDYTKARDATTAMIAELNKAGDSADADGLSQSLPDLTSLVNDSQATSDRTCKV